MTADEEREATARIVDLVEDLVDVVRAGDDLGDVLSCALGQAADRVGGVEALVAGRPGSWEADHVRQLAEQYATQQV